MNQHGYPASRRPAAPPQRSQPAKAASSAAVIQLPLLLEGVDRDTRPPPGASLKHNSQLDATTPKPPMPPPLLSGGSHQARAMRGATKQDIQAYQERLPLQGVT